MERSEEIVLAIIKELYPEWIKRKRAEYGELGQYEQFEAIFREVFHYDIRKACGERDHAIDYTELNRKINIIKLNSQLQDEIKKKEKKQ